MYDSKAHAHSTKSLGKGQWKKHTDSLHWQGQAKSPGIQSTCIICKAVVKKSIQFCLTLCSQTYLVSLSFSSQLLRDYQQGMSIYIKPLILKWRKMEFIEKKWLTQEHRSTAVSWLYHHWQGDVWIADTRKLTICYFPNCFIPSPHTK